MDALDVEMSIAEGEQALQALLTFARESAGKLEAHEAEKGIFKRLLPIGLAAMKLLLRPARDRRCGPGRHAGRRRAPAAGAASCEGGTTSRSSASSRWPGPATAARGAGDLPAGRAGQPPRAVLLVLPAGVDDPVRGRAPLPGECGLLCAALRPRGGRERA